jgi:hypothetical protein
MRGVRAWWKPAAAVAVVLDSPDRGAARSLSGTATTASGIG